MIPEPSSSVVLEKDSAYLPESWTWYIIGVVVIALRWLVRVRTVGFKGLKPDDYLTVLFTALWTINAVVAQITYYTGGNVDVLPAQAPTLSDYDVWVLSYGSIWEFASWYTYSGNLWTLKLQVLFFYRRLNLDLLRPQAVNVVFVFTCLAYVALALTISLSCRPYHLNWQIDPLPGPECTFRPQNFWTLAVLNVVTDLAIMSIPAPLILRLRVSWARKLGVSALLLSGLFMVSTALVRAVQTLRGAPSVVNINRWGFREQGVGVIAVNAAVLLPLLTRRFWRRGAPRADPVRVAPEERAQPLPAPAAAKWNVLWVRTLSIISISGGRTADRDVSRGADQGAGARDLEQGHEEQALEPLARVQVHESSPGSLRDGVGRPGTPKTGAAGSSEHLEADVPETTEATEERPSQARNISSGYQKTT